MSAAGLYLLTASIRHTGRVNWRWWIERAVFVLSVPALVAVFWLVLVETPK